MSDYEADDERFGTRRQRFIEDEMEGQLGEDWGMENQAGRKEERTTRIKEITQTTTSSFVKTSINETYALSAGTQDREIVEVDIRKPSSLKHHSSTAINLEFDTAPVIVALPVRDGLWREKDGDAKRMQASSASRPIREAGQIAENNPVIDSVSKTSCDTGKEVCINNDKATCKLYSSRDKPPVRETHQSTSKDLVLETAPTIMPDLTKEKVVKDTSANTTSIQQVNNRRLTTTSGISRTTSAHESIMQAPAILSKALGRSKSGTAFSRTTSAQELTMKAPAVPLRARDSLSSTTAFSRTKSAQELPMQALKTTSPIRGKEKGKAISLPVPALPTLDQPQPPASTSRNSPPRTIKIPPTLQLIHENFANFEMAVGVAQSGGKVRFKKGKGMFAMDKVDLRRQSELFKDCVVVVAHHISAKADQLVPRWAQIHRHGGKVCDRYIPEVTHVACDHDVVPASLCHYLAINSLSDLPREIPILAWDWFHKCSTTSQLLAIEMFLRPCLRGQTSVSRRLSSTSSMGAGKRKSEHDILNAMTANKRSKKYAPTDSDTSQSQRNGRYIDTQAYATSPEPMAVDDNGSFHILRKRTREGALGDDEHGRDDDEEPTRAARPVSSAKVERWRPPTSGEAVDPLDEMISGMVKGTLVQTEQELAEEARLLDESTVDGFAKISRMGVRSGVLNQKASKSDGPYKCQNAHTGVEPISLNDLIIEGLESLSKMYEKVQHKTQWQKRAYTKAIASIRNCPYPIQNLEQALQLKDVGDSMGDRIAEILRNGGISDRERFEDNEQLRTITAFGHIYGVGPAKANELWSDGARSLDDLRKGDWGLTEAQKIGLVHYADLKCRIPLPEVERLFEQIKKEAMHIEGCGSREKGHLKIEAMGSYRRGEETSGDLDILITRDPSDGKDHTQILRKLVARLAEKRVIMSTLSAPSNYEDVEAKWMGLGQIVGSDGKPEGPVRRIGESNPTNGVTAVHINQFRLTDILAVPWENYGAALIYFTGNEIFNRSLRLFARRNGYSLNQRGLYKGAVRDEKNRKTAEGVLVASRTEQDIFNVLGIRYRPPHLRRP